MLDAGVVSLCFPSSSIPCQYLIDLSPNAGSNEDVAIEEGTHAAGQETVESSSARGSVSSIEAAEEAEVRAEVVGITGAGRESAPPNDDSKGEEDSRSVS